LCEARLQAASILKDYNGFAKHLEYIEPLYANHPSLRARHARWVRGGRDRFGKLIAVLEHTPARAAWASRIQAELRVNGQAAEGEYLLSLVLSEIGLDSGQLYAIDGRGVPVLQASRPIPPDPALVSAATRCSAAWSDANELNTADADADAGQALDSDLRPHIPLWLTHSVHPDRLVGFLLLPCEPSYLGKLTPAFVRALAMQLEASRPG
jgi:hypothetical protein